MKPIWWLTCLAALAPCLVPAAEDLRVEPLEIGTTPQFLIDSHVVDNTWALKYKREAIERVFHQPQKQAANPLIAADGGFMNVLRDTATGRFQMWYQVWEAGGNDERSKYAIAYATSDDGLAWTRPKLGLFDWQGSKQNNIVWPGARGRRASSPSLLEVPERDRRGFRYLMLYRETDGMRIVGSQDGVHWDPASDFRISPIHSDTQNAIVYDSLRQQYLMFCRAKHVYRAFGEEMLDTGESRRVARAASDSLWTLWDAEPQNILIPDDLDERQGFNCFYGMPVRYYAGIFWGALWPFKMNTDIHTELTFSRDGVRFDRLPARPKLIERGPDGAWDDGMVFGSSNWVEVGDQWWFYYSGWDGPHGTRERTPGIGVATMRKEGFVSLRGPKSGGVMVTRALRWPGGELLLNAATTAGEVQVRVTDARRRPLPGFDYADCVPFRSDATAHAMTFKGGRLAAHQGQVVRLEFLLKDADLYTFRATGVKNN